MGRMERLSVDIPREVNEIVEEAVASGEFTSASEMVSSALAEWKSTRLIHGYTVEELRALVDEADASGEFIDGETARREIEEELEAYIAAKRGQ
ncbi:ribbon-helix-helix domain-containing protein [Rhizobium sp. LjRoot254]|uniref:ribbon-helix-helix domain-containing protein n=1 Tax=Rhizobium sp. LjRoot254 TaxID=3342297 RepID=UPI003ECF1B69